jgi:hypothetical protein
MFGRGNFRDCITDSLKTKGYGAKRTKELLEVFERKVNAYDRQGLGHPDADTRAMADTFAEAQYNINEKIKRANNNFLVIAQTRAAVLKGFEISTSALVGDKGAGVFSGGKGVGVARAIASRISNDPRFKSIGGADYANTRASYYDKYIALFGAELDHLSKGAFGTQKGVEHLDAVLDELFGVTSGNKVAGDFAASTKRIQKVMVEDFNSAGGSLRYNENFVMPQKMNIAKLLKTSQQEWVDHHMKLVDWNKMQYPDGTLIPAERQREALEKSYDTLSTGGANKIKDNDLNGYGGSVGNQLEKDRFIVYKGPKEWKEAHEAYGDGNIVDVITGHMLRMATQSAQVKVFGASPSMWISTAKSIAMKEMALAKINASKPGSVSTGIKLKPGEARTLQADFDSAMGRVEDMFTSALHQNAMDPNSTLGAVTTTTSNLLTGAQLGSAVIPAIPGDFVTSAAVNLLNGTGFKLGVDTYVKGMAPGGYGNLLRMMARVGFNADEHISSTMIAERFSGLSTYGAPISRRISDTVLRMSGLNRHTNVARATQQLELMGMLVEFSHVDYGDNMLRKVFERYGINEQDWNDFRKITPTSPDGGNATYLTPMSILDTSLKNKDELYRKFYTMIHNESNMKVLASGLEASVVAKGMTQPDTVAGMIMHSFAMYKNFPLTMAMTYGRLGLAEPEKLTRIKFYAGLMVGLWMVGAVSTQVRELTKGRTPLDMSSGKFWGKAFLAGGAGGLYGDFLFSGTTEYGKGAAETALGPLIGAYSDVLNLTVGSGFKYLDQAEKQEEFNANLMSRGVDFAKRYAPGSSVWWARLAVEREIWDRVQHMADPKAREKWKRKERKQREEYGNAYWSQPGGLVGN